VAIKGGVRTRRDESIKTCRERGPGGKEGDTFTLPRCLLGPGKGKPLKGDKSSCVRNSSRKKREFGVELKDRPGREIKRGGEGSKKRGD